MSSSKWRHRYTALAIVFCIWVLSYLDRMVMATAIPSIAKEFGLSDAQRGFVLSSFFIGYAVCQIPGGILSDKFGARRVMVVAVACWSVFTALTGYAFGFASLILIRILFGVCEGVAPTATWRALANWTPADKRGLYNGIMMSTNSLGPALAPLFVVAILQAWGWHTVFHLLFIPGIILAVWIWFKLPDDPRQKKGISQLELDELAAENVLDGKPVTAAKKMKFFEVLAVPSVWKSFFLLFFINITAWGYMSWLPSYLLDARQMDIKSMGWVASLPFFLGTIGAILSGITMKAIFKGRANIQLVVVGALCALFLYLTYSASTMESMIVFNCCAGFFVFYSAITVFNIPMATVPKEISGRAMGIVNTAGQLAGFLSPLIIGFMIKTSDSGVKDYSLPFGFLVGATLIAVVLALFCKMPKTTDVAA